MAFLAGLAAVGEAGDEYLKFTTAQANQQLKQQQIQLREAQLAFLMEKTTTAQQKSLNMSDENARLRGAEADVLGLGGDTDPSTALPFASPAPAGGPPAGQTGAAGLPPFAAPPASGGAPTGRSMPMGQFPASQPPAAAGAGLPAPSPQAGQPAAQLGGMPQGQPIPPGGQPQMPPGPGGAPSFDQRFQGQPQPQPQPIQAKPVQTQRILGQQPSLGAGPPQAPLPDQTFRPQQPKGKRLFDLATPEQQAQAGITQPQQQKGTQVAGEWKKGDPLTGDNLMQAIRKTRPDLSPAEAAKLYDHMMPNVRATEASREKQTKQKQAEEAAKHVDPAMVKAIGEYRERPLPMYGKAGERNRATMEQVLEQYPDYDEKKYWGGQTAERAKGALPSKEEMSFITKDSGAVKSFNVLVPHLDTLQNTVEALNAGYNNVPSQFLRQIRNYWLEKFGSELPTDFKGVKDIVGFELIKAITGGAQALGDREEIRKALDAANSPKQLLSLIQRYRELSTGQLRGLEQKYKSQTQKDDFEERFLSEGTRKLFLDQGTARGGKSQSPTAPQPGEIRRFKDGKTRIFKGGDDLDPKNWDEAT